MSTVFLVSLHVDEKQLATILGTIAGSATLVSITPTEITKTVTDPHRFVGGVRDKGISGPELILETLTKAKRVVTTDELEAAFAARGFSRVSYSSPLHILLKSGKVVRAGHKKYLLKGTVVKMGASS